MLHVGEKQIVKMELVDAAVRQAALSNAVGALCQDVVAGVAIQLKLNSIDDEILSYRSAVIILIIGLTVMTV